MRHPCPALPCPGNSKKTRRAAPRPGPPGLRLPPPPPARAFIYSHPAAPHVSPSFPPNSTTHTISLCSQELTHHTTDHTRAQGMATRADVEKGGVRKEPGKVPSPLYPQHEGEREWVPWIVPVFFVANITVFVVAMYVNNCPAHTTPRDGKCVARFLGRFSFQPLRQNPLLGPSSATLTKMGALVWEKVVHHHQGWRLLSSMWLHAGVLHLVANMLCLLFVGMRLEQQFGYVRIGAIYVLSGLGGAVLSSLFIRNHISVGASGALFGLLGAMLSELLTNWTIYTNKAAAVATLLFVAAVNLVLGILPHVNNFAHIGGFLAGFLLGFVVLMRPHFGWMERYSLPAGAPCTARKYLAYQWILLAVALLLLVVGFAVGMAMVFRGANANDSCHWCHYLSCVPTARWNCAN